MSSNSEIVGIDTFFEASRFGCYKTKSDVTKVIYNMYSCYTSCMSRVMIEMDSRDCAKCQNSGKKRHRCHFEILNDNRKKA